MNISKRLQSVAGLVGEVATLCDVGTDHAYIPIYLLERKKIGHAIAMDIGEGPLERAKENIKKHDFDAYIETRLSDGLTNLRGGEADTIVIAGMGGDLIIRILDMADPELFIDTTLVLSPHSEWEKVRTYLYTKGFTIFEELMVVDEGKYYIILKVSKDGIKQALPARKYLRFGRYLVNKKDGVLHAYIEKEYKKYMMILKGLKERPTTTLPLLERIEEISAYIKDIEEICHEM